MTTKTRKDVEGLISDTESRIKAMNDQIATLAQSQSLLEARISELEQKRDELEGFINTVPELLAKGAITLEQFTETGNQVDQLTTEIERLSRVHEGSEMIVRTNHADIYELQDQLRQRRKMLTKLTIKEAALSLAKSGKAELEKLVEQIKSINFNAELAPLLGAEILAGLDELSKGNKK